MFKLIVINLVLFTSAYFLVEKKEIDKKISSLNSEYILTPSIFKKLEKIQLKNFSMQKNEEKWTSESSIELNQKEVSRLLKRLTFLKISREFETCSEEMRIDLELPIQIQTNFKVYIGMKTNFSDEFYLKKNDTCYLVKDISPQEKPLPEEVFRLNPYKQKFWKKFSRSYGEQLLEKKLAVSGVDSVLISSKRNRPVTISKLGTTKQSPFLGIEYLENRINDYFTFLETRVAKKVRRIKSDDELGGLYGSIVINKKVKKELSLFNLLNNKEGFYVVDSDHPNFVYEFESNIENLFKVTAQDFWDKRIYKSIEQLTGTFIFDGKKFKFETVGEKLNFFDKEVRPNFPELYKVLKTLNSPAFFISRLTKDKANETFSNSDLKIVTKSSATGLIWNDKIISVIDLKRSLAFEYKNERKLKQFNKGSLF